MNLKILNELDRILKHNPNLKSEKFQLYASIFGFRLWLGGGNIILQKNTRITVFTGSASCGENFSPTRSRPVTLARLKKS